MKLQRLYSLIRQALDEYEMIDEGDHVAIGISGGKDSLTLLYGLAGLRKFYPQKFTLSAITVDLGYEGMDLSKIAKLCADLDVDYHIVRTQIKDMISEGTCSLCARLRKGAFNTRAMELGCNKIAYAHSMDDVVETMMMSLIYEGRFCAFWPVTPFEDTNLTVIRPMIYVPTADVIGFQHKHELPIVKSLCPYDRKTERTYIRDLLKEVNRHTPGVNKRLMTAIKNGHLEGWDPALKKSPAHDAP